MAKSPHFTRRGRFVWSVIGVALILVVGIIMADSETRQAGATVPGANGKIAFFRYPDNAPEIQSSELVVMNPDGTEQVTVSYGAASPAWSPDGARIAFWSGVFIYVINADGTGLTNMTHGEHPAWSPDGSKIAYSSRPSLGDYEIYVMAAPGSPVQGGRLTTSPGHDQHPEWSPDGTKIAFDHSDGGPPSIYAMNADGNERVRLTNSGYNQEPSWSPDGSKIAFSGDADIIVMNADGSDQRHITNSPDDGSNDVSPDWSPDGKHIVFSRIRVGGNWDIYVMNADGTAQTRLTTDPDFVEVTPAWQALLSGPGLTTPTPAPTSAPTSTFVPGSVGGTLEAFRWN